MDREDFFYLECIGKGIYKLSAYSKYGKSCEIVLDEDDLEEFEHQIHKARRAKVTIEG